MNDLISRWQAIRWVKQECNPYGKPTLDFESGKRVMEHLEMMPSAQPDIIRCKDCEYLCNEDGLRGMCWHINGFGTDVKDKYNSFCSWAERREDG